MGFIYTWVKKIGYKVIDVVTLGTGVPTKINGVKLKLPTKYFRLFPADYEKDNFEFFKKHIKQGDIILDIGAHIGLFAIFFAKLSKGKVYSFEPTPATLKWLKKTIDINHCNNIVTIVPKAISDKAGKAKFFVSPTSDISVANSLIGYEDGVMEVRDGSYEVDMISIDEFVKEKRIKPNILKIDAEGVELQLLKGAADTFLNCRPIATLGLHLFAYKNKKETLAEIWDILISYRMNIFIDEQPVTKEIFCSKEGWVFDVQLIPEN